MIVSQVLLVATLVVLTRQGGEVAFVQRLVADSAVLGSRIRWYTSMLGCRASLAPLRAALRDRGITNVHTTTFVQVCSPFYSRTRLQTDLRAAHTAGPWRGRATPLPRRRTCCTPAPTPQFSRTVLRARNGLRANGRGCPP